MKKKWVEQYPVCQGCGRGWNEVTHSAKGFCRGCSRKKQYTEDKQNSEPKVKWAEQFDKCQSPSCPNTMNGITQQPHQAHGLCNSCYSIWHRGENLEHYHDVEEVRRMRPEVIQYMKDYMAEYYPENREKWPAYSEKWRTEKRDDAIAAWSRYREANREICRDSYKKWYDENPEKASAQGRKQRQENPEQYRQYNRNRRARLAGLEGIFTEDEWIDICEAHEFKCYHCGTHLEDTEEKRLTPDHLVPIDSKDIEPSNDIDNIGPLCSHCNSSKRVRSLFEFDCAYLEKRATKLISEGKTTHCVVQLWESAKHVANS